MVISELLYALQSCNSSLSPLSQERFLPNPDLSGSGTFITFITWDFLDRMFSTAVFISTHTSQKVVISFKWRVPFLSNKRRVFSSCFVTSSFERVLVSGLSDVYRFGPSVTLRYFTRSSPLKWVPASRSAVCSRMISEEELNSSSQTID